ncbi:hypothetical protein KY495_12715 [Massilia sp. PAMC28688]|uniref:hypothetical protein n=1 Tax=Massilia sp. PAMC28688 TaxID=2861283 RepID=UPI001C62A7F4|nr:hypothetical protein [Massilia sp. PAMC28688]QYF91668.1 hypothetical protein KY495_12715 [Massilia sp. PAMC28688]
MKALFAFAIVIGMSPAAHADTTKELVRIACVPEAGLLDVEIRGLHDSVATDPKHRVRREAILAKAGFHDPRGLKSSCVLGNVTYLVTTERGAQSNAICGASPHVYLTVTRNGEKLFSDVIFGSSCQELPSLTRFTVGDGPHSWRGRETRACYSPGTQEAGEVCEWTSGDAAQFSRRFPVEQETISQILTRKQRP